MANPKLPQARFGPLLEFRPVWGSEGGYRTPVPDLYMCGSACYPGPGVTFLPGYNSAHVVLEDLA